MRTAFLFSGQGTELAWIGETMARAVPQVKELVERAARAVHVPPDDLWARGGRLLEQTEIYQPVFTGVTLGIHAALLESGIAPFVTAGHSLGEVPAWAAAGGISADDAVLIAAERGRLMAECAATRPGGLLAVVGTAEIGNALALGAAHGHTYIAAMNSPGEWVLGGDEPALRAIAGAFTSVRVPIGGPWHGPAMEPAAQRFHDYLTRFSTCPLQVRFVSNLTGQLVSDNERMPALMARQLIQPVKWVDTLRTLRELRVTDVVMVGPGKLLRSLMHRNAFAGVQLHATERPDLLTRTVERLRT